MQASDADIGANAQIRYTISGVQATFFNIDPLSGVLQVSEEGSRALDREQMPYLELQVSSI